MRKVELLLQANKEGWQNVRKWKNVSNRPWCGQCSASPTQSTGVPATASRSSIFSECGMNYIQSVPVPKWWTQIIESSILDIVCSVSILIESITHLLAVLGVVFFFGRAVEWCHLRTVHHKFANHVWEIIDVQLKEFRPQKIKPCGTTGLICLIEDLI